MKVSDAIESRRSIRKFDSNVVSPENLTELVRLGRLYASAINAQPIRFAIVQEKENKDLVFSSLNWAMRLKDFTIAPDERPASYLLLCSDSNPGPFFEFDAGAAATTVMLAAREMQLETCVLKIARPEIIEKSLLPEGFRAVYAIALGKGKIKSEIVNQKDDPGYYLTENGDFRVPKKTTESVLIFNDIKKG